MATRTLITLAALAAVSSPAISACHIVVAEDRASTLEIYRHELAHCHGWEHPDQGHKGKPRNGYQAPKPPAHFVKPYPNLIVHWVDSKTALETCGSFGCQWHE